MNIPDFLFLSESPLKALLNPGNCIFPGYPCYPVEIIEVGVFRKITVQTYFQTAISQ